MRKTLLSLLFVLLFSPLCRAGYEEAISSASTTGNTRDPYTKGLLMGVGVGGIFAGVAGFMIAFAICSQPKKQKNQKEKTGKVNAAMA